MMSIERSPGLPVSSPESSPESNWSISASVRPRLQGVHPEDDFIGLSMASTRPATGTFRGRDGGLLRSSLPDQPPASHIEPPVVCGALMGERAGLR